MFYLTVAYVAVATHMLQGYVPNASSILDVCCSKSSMFQVFHEAHAIPRAQTVPTGWVSTGGATRRAKRRRTAWRGRAAGRNKQQQGASKQ